MPYKYVQGTGYSVHMQRKQALRESSSVERFVNDIYNICTHNVSFIGIVAALYSQEKHAIRIWIYYVNITDGCNIQRLKYNEVAFQHFNEMKFLLDLMDAYVFNFLFIFLL